MKGIKILDDVNKINLKNSFLDRIFVYPIYHKIKEEVLKFLFSQSLNSKERSKLCCTEIDRPIVDLTSLG